MKLFHPALFGIGLMLFLQLSQATPSFESEERLVKRSDPSSKALSRCSCYLLSGLSRQLCLATRNSALPSAPQDQASSSSAGSVSAADILACATGFAVCAECGYKTYNAIDDCARRRRTQREGHERVACEEEQAYRYGTHDSHLEAAYEREDSSGASTQMEAPQPVEQMRYPSYEEQSEGAYHDAEFEQSKQKPESSSRRRVRGSSSRPSGGK